MSLTKPYKSYAERMNNRARMRSAWTGDSPSLVFGGGAVVGLGCMVATAAIASMAGVNFYGPGMTP